MIAESQRDRVIAQCAAEPGSAENYPFRDGVAVFKVAGKMFALVSLDTRPGRASLRCDPDLAVVLRGRFPAVTAGYHLSKRHWNTIELDGSLLDGELLDLIDHSYDLVVAGLTQPARARLST